MVPFNLLPLTKNRSYTHDCLRIKQTSNKRLLKKKHIIRLGGLITNVPDMRKSPKALTIWWFFQSHMAMILLIEQMFYWMLQRWLVYLSPCFEALFTSTLPGGTSAIYCSIWKSITGKTNDYLAVKIPPVSLGAPPLESSQHCHKLLIVLVLTIVFPT